MRRKKHQTMCGLRPRAFATMLSREPFVIRMTYPCGYHKDTLVEKDKIWRHIAPVLLVRWTTGERGYWTKAGGGLADECPRCRRAAIAEARKVKS